MFKQDIASFVKSKTNWVSVISILFGVYGLLTGAVAFEIAFAYVEGGLLGIGVRDAL